MSDKPALVAIPEGLRNEAKCILLSVVMYIDPALGPLARCIMEHINWSRCDSYPGHDVLREWTGLDRRSVQRGLRRLIDEHGILIEISQGRGRGKASVYYPDWALIFTLNNAWVPQLKGGGVSPTFSRWRQDQKKAASETAFSPLQKAASGTAFPPTPPTKKGGVGRHEKAALDDHKRRRGIPPQPVEVTSRRNQLPPKNLNNDFSGRTSSASRSEKTEGTTPQPQAEKRTFVSVDDERWETLSEQQWMESWAEPKPVANQQQGALGFEFPTEWVEALDKKSPPPAARGSAPRRSTTNGANGAGQQHKEPDDA